LLASSVTQVLFNKHDSVSCGSNANEEPCTYDNPSQQETSFHLSNVSDESVEEIVVCDTLDSSVHSANLSDHDHDIPFPKLYKFRNSFKKNFIFAHLNVNGLYSKHVEIHEILRCDYVDFLAIGESKLYPELQMNFKVDNYNFYRKDRPNVNCLNAGGGLAAYISSVVPHRLRNDISFNQDGIEDMVFEISMKKTKWFFILMYRPPSVQIRYLREAIKYLYERCGNQSQNIVILGDLNVNFNDENNQLQDELDIYALSNFVQGPTCFKSQINPSSVDVILTSNTKKFTSTLNIDIGVSDHHTIVLAATKMHAPKADKKVIYYNSFKNFNEDDFLADLTCAPFQTGLIFDDIDDHLWYHNTLLENIINIHAPKKKRTIRNRQLVYMNGELRKAINVKAMLRRKWNRVPSRENFEKFRSQRNLVTKLKRKSLKHYFDEKCSKTQVSHNPGQFWSSVKPSLGESSKGSSNINLCENGVVFTDPSDVCNILNDYYVSMTDDFSKDESVSLDDSIDQIINAYKDHPSIVKIKEKRTESEISFNFCEVTYSELHKKLKSVKTNKATGFDGISPKMVNIGAPVLALSFLPIVNKGIKESSFPSTLKNGDITPIFKKDDPLNKEKYRPVSVLPSLSKPYESILFDQLMAFFWRYFISIPICLSYRLQYSACPC
jgi:hypothetical protein